MVFVEAFYGLIMLSGAVFIFSIETFRGPFFAPNHGGQTLEGLGTVDPKLSKLPETGDPLHLNNPEHHYS